MLDDVGAGVKEMGVGGIVAVGDGFAAEGVEAGGFDVAGKLGDAA